MLVPPHHAGPPEALLSPERHLRAVLDLVLTAKTYPAYEAYCPGEAAKLDAYALLAQDALRRLEAEGATAPQDLSWVPRAREVCTEIVQDIERRYGEPNLSTVAREPDNHPG